MGKLKIHSENILPIIKKWLYSEKEIFVRELVSNACDAIYKRLKITGKEPGEPRIEVTLDAASRTLTFADNGLGMDSKEVETCIAQIAFSGAEEFVKKYQSDKEGDQIIGHFGLGFYSAYMVAEKVEIDSLSYKEGAEAIHWSCDGSIDYTLSKGDLDQVGTRVTLTLEKDADEYLEEARIRENLHRFCSFLPYPIFLNGKQINEKPPLWVKPASECTEQEYLDFYRHLYPLDPDPLFWIHLNVDFPFHLKGILYFPKISEEQDLKRESLKLFCNRVYVSDNCRDLLPEYLSILRGAIDSPDIPLNVSRSYLQVDPTVRQLGGHISKKISDRLAALHQSESEKFYACWPDIELIIKFGAIQDEKFYERVKSFLVWKNSDEVWTTLEDYRERHPDQPIYYAAEAKGHFLDLYKHKGIEVLIIRQSMIDQALLHFLERKSGASFKRIDSTIDESLLDPSKEKTLLDAEGRSEAAKIAEFFRKKLDIEVEAKSLASESVPGFLMFKEEERRMRDQLAMRNPEMMQGLVKPTFVINTNHKLIQAIQLVGESDDALAQEMVREVYDLARLSQREMDSGSIGDFIERSTQVLEKLACRAVKN